MAYTWMQGLLMLKVIIQYSQIPNLGNVRLLLCYIDDNSKE